MDNNIVLYSIGGISASTLILLLRMSFQMGRWIQKVEDLEGRIERLESGRRPVRAN